MTRYPRVELVLEATRIAEALRAGAEALDTLAEIAPHFETSDLEYRVKALVLGTIEAVIVAER